MDSLNKGIQTLMKFTRGQEVPDINKDIFINNKCPPVHFSHLAIFLLLYLECSNLVQHFLYQLNSLAEDSFRDVFCLPAAGMAEEDPEDDNEEEEKAPKKKVAPRVSKRPRAKVSGTDAGASGEASANKARTKAPQQPHPYHVKIQPPPLLLNIIHLYHHEKD
jgi:hypothetical protein